MVLNALLPEVFALVPALEEKLHRIFMVHVVLRVQFDEKLFSLERYFADFRPREGVYSSDTLEDGDAHVSDGQIERNAFVVFGRVHFHSIQLTASGRFQQVEIRFRR